MIIMMRKVNVTSMNRKEVEGKKRGVVHNLITLENNNKVIEIFLSSSSSWSCDSLHYEEFN